MKPNKDIDIKSFDATFMNRSLTVRREMFRELFQSFDLIEVDGKENCLTELGFDVSSDVAIIGGTFVTASNEPNLAMLLRASQEGLIAQTPSMSVDAQRWPISSKAHAKVCQPFYSRKIRSVAQLRELLRVWCGWRATLAYQEAGELMIKHRAVRTKQDWFVTASNKLVTKHS